jgi:hypothetical protein
MTRLSLLLVLCSFGIIHAEIEDDFCKSEKWRADLKSFNLLYPRPVLISHKRSIDDNACGESLCRFLYANNGTTETFSGQTSEKFLDYKYAKWSIWASRNICLQSDNLFIITLDFSPIAFPNGYFP